MRHWLESLQRLPTDSLRGRIRRYQFREFLLQIEQFVIETIVLLIRDRRLGQHVISVVVLADFLDEIRVAGFGFVERHGKNVRRSDESLKAETLRGSGLVDYLIGGFWAKDVRPHPTLSPKERVVAGKRDPSGG